MSDYMALSIRVKGYASSRWQGARHGKEAAENNLALSAARAKWISDRVAAKLRSALPIVTITQNVLIEPKGAVDISSQAFGSKMPIIKEDANGDHPFNRVVQVSISCDYSGLQDRLVQRIAYLDCRTQFWVIDDVSVKGAARGFGAMVVRFRLTNTLAKKSRRYESTLGAIGEDTPGVDEVLKLSVFDGAKTFRTARAMAFTEFENTPVSMCKGKVGVGVGADKLSRVPLIKRLPLLKHLKIGVAFSTSVLMFDKLGGSASEGVLFESQFSLSGLDVGGFYGKGILKATEPDPGSSREFIDQQWVPELQQRSTLYDMIVPFGTGSSIPDETSAGVLDKWVHNFAAGFRALMDSGYIPGNQKMGNH